MDITPSGLWCNWVPQLPKITWTSLLATLGKTENAEHQDVLTQIVVASARPILQSPASLKKSQDFFTTDWPVLGRIWVSKYTIPAAAQARPASSGFDIREAVRIAINALNPPYLSQDPCSIPESVAVSTEWTAYRPNAYPTSRLPRGDQRSLYNRMMQDVNPAGPTILYFHGGAHCLMDPATHRFATSSLAQESGGRVLSVRYRLSPQHIFPAALIDAFTAYLALLHPPPDTFHTPVPPQNIVLAGDSSGGGIAASLLLLLLELQRQNITINIPWKDETITLPSTPCAGLALASPYLDITRSLPSAHANARWDIVAPPPLDSASPPFPADGIWPTQPPRTETYCEAAMCAHPLVSPVSAERGMWRGAPGVYVCVGWEGFSDEAEVLARKVWEGNRSWGGGDEKGGVGDGAKVVFDGFEGMPHCFAVVPFNWAGREGLRRWGRFCGDVVRGQNRQRESRRGTATWTSSKTGAVREVGLGELGLTQVGCGYERKVGLDDEEVDRRIEEGMRWRVMLEEEMVRKWKEEGNLAQFGDV